MSIFQEYLDAHEKYVKKYGKKTVVLMQVGDFYEMYSTDERGPNLEKIGILLRLKKTQKNKNKPHINEKNPYVCGFNMIALKKFADKLVFEYEYTVVIMEQTGSVNKNTDRIDRQVTRILSVGTYVDESIPDSNNIVCIFVSEEEQFSGEILQCFGMTSIDVGVGNCNYSDAYSNSQDKKYAIDECFRFIRTFNPKEIILCHNDDNVNLKNIVKNLNIDEKSIFIKKIKKEYQDYVYQDAFFNKIYPGAINNDSAGMEKNPLSIISFIMLSHFIENHSINIINSLNRPKLWDNKKYLVLCNDAAKQLNIFKNNEGTRKHCLFNIVNNTTTSIGRRFLMWSLNNPLTDYSSIKKRIEITGELVDNNLYMDIEDKLRNIYDIERILRKMRINKLSLYELDNLIGSCVNAFECVKLLKNNKRLRKIIPPKKDIKLLVEFINFCFDTFIVDDLRTFEWTYTNISEISTSFFTDKFDKNISDKNKELVFLQKYAVDVVDKLSQYIKNTYANTRNGKIQLKSHKRDGYYLLMTKERCKEFRKNIKDIKEIQISEGNILQTEDLKYDDRMSSGTKIYFKDLSNNSINIEKTYYDLIKMLRTKYTEVINNILNKYEQTIRIFSDFISELDFYKSNAKTAIKNNYFSPIIKKSESSFIDCEQLRHPIVEKINTKKEYVPHNVKICEEGWLLFGLNSSGKSTLMKAIGISIIMAQCGMYVPSSKFVFSPYTKLFARISGNDDFYRGLSSFALEMTELKTIIQRNDKHSMIIGDEICRGTENLSANSIVASAIMKLSESNASFIFATHLHKVPQLPHIQKLKNINCYHLSVSYDSETDSLIFDRKIKKGRGEGIYGITVAKYIIDDSNFIEQATEIKNYLMDNKHDQILSNKRSKYNSKLIIDSCKICGKTPGKDEIPLDTHHINHQEDCENGTVKVKPYMNKNDLSNLVSLCKKCHTDHHNGLIDIYGYKDTSKGIVLDYKIISDYI